MRRISSYPAMEKETERQRFHKEIGGISNEEIRRKIRLIARQRCLSGFFYFNLLAFMGECLTFLWITLYACLLSRCPKKQVK